MPFDNVFGGPTFQVPRFSTGQVAEILELPIWRLQKFLDVKSYPLSPSGQIGRGLGSRRTFSTADICRIASAAFLLADGFSPKFVSKALQYIEDEDLFRLDKEGNIVATGIVFRRGKGGATMNFVPTGQLRRLDAEVYYVLDLERLVNDVASRIARFQSGQER